MPTFAALRVLVFLLAFSCTIFPCRADDLNDGIEIDDGVDKYSEINTPKKNFSYLAQRARSKASSGASNIISSKEGALNSVLIEPGARLNGDIVIIDQSKGNRTIINE